MPTPRVYSIITRFFLFDSLICPGFTWIRSWIKSISLVSSLLRCIVHRYTRVHLFLGKVDGDIFSKNTITNINATSNYIMFNTTFVTTYKPVGFQVSFKTSKETICWMGILRVVKPQFWSQNLAELCSAQHCQSALKHGWVLEAVDLTLPLGLVFFQGSQMQI